MSLFLPREIGSIETGPQTFAGTIVPRTTFLFRAFPPPPDPPGLLNSVLVKNAGYTDLNGTFNYTADFNFRPYYNKDGNSNWFIVWFLNQWQIYDFSINVIDPVYFSTEDVLYPWAVETWLSNNPIYNPVPIVTKVL